MNVSLCAGGHITEVGLVRTVMGLMKIDEEGGVREKQGRTDLIYLPTCKELKLTLRELRMRR